MKMVFSILLVCLSGMCLLGCGGPQKPNGFPDTVPFTLTVTRDGAPLADASVQVYPEMSSDVATTGMSDANGVVSLTTVRGSYSKAGVPVGTFKVTVNKSPVIPGELSREECLKMSPDESVEYSKKLKKLAKDAIPEVAKKFNSVDTTPLSVTITARGAATVEVTAK